MNVYVFIYKILIFLYNCSVNSNKIIYDWKRCWTPHRSNEESHFEYSSLYDTKETTLADLRDKKCLILLGDAALGKSTALKQEWKNLEKEKIGVYFLDLKCISDHVSLRDKFIELKKYCNRKSKVYLLMDSFDEGYLVFDNIVNCLIDNLKLLDLEKLFIRITCRTVVFPKYLYDELSKLSCNGKCSYENNGVQEILAQQLKLVKNNKNVPLSVEIYKLLPLKKEDINLVLEKKNISKDDFYSNILFSEELKTPITALYIIENYPIINTLSQFEIYNNICHKLCNEYNGKINKQVLNTNERLEIAATLFTLMLFSNKYLISYDNSISEFTKQSTFYAQKYFKDLKNVFDILRFSIPASNLEEVLNTGLFTGDYDCITCVQKTYMEFLVAKFIIKNNLYNNFKNLIFDEYNKVLPFFVNTICWLADQNDDIFEEVYLKDPDILLTSIVSFSSEEKNIKLLKKLYELSKSDVGIHGLNSYYRVLRKLVISKDSIISTVEEYLKSKDSTYVTISIQLLDINKITKFEDYIFDIAISNEYNIHCRLEALYFLKEHSCLTLYKISDHIDNFIVENIEESSKYAFSLINLLLPNNLSEQNFLKLINQNLDDKFYYYVEPEKIVQNKDFHKILLSNLIQPFLNDERNDTIHIDKLLKKLVENLPCEDVEYCANFIYEVLNCFYLYSLETELYSLFKKINRNLKYKIFDYIFNHILLFRSQDICYVYYYNFFDKHDLIFIIKQLVKSEDKRIRKFIYDLCIHISPFYKYISYYSIIKSLINDIIDFIKNKKLTYQQYRLYRLWEKLKTLNCEIKNIYCKLKNRILRTRPIDLLRNILNKTTFNENDWNNCIYYLSYIKNNEKMTFNFCPINYEYIDEFNLLSQKEQKQLFNLAEFYVGNQSYNTVQINNRLTTTSLYPFSDMLIVPGMYILYKQNEKKLYNLLNQKDLIKRSLPYIINYPIGNNSYNEMKSCRIELLKYCINSNEPEFLKTLESIIDTKLSVTNKEIYLEFLEDFYTIDNENLNNMLFVKLSSLVHLEDYTYAEIYIFEHISKYLTIKKYNPCVDFFKSIIKKENTTIQLKAIAAKFLAHYNNNTFNIYKDLLENNEEFAKDFISAVSKGCFAMDSYQEDKLNLNSIELAQFFIILEKYYPASEDTYPNGIVTTRDEITDLRRLIINKSINYGDLEFFNYIKNNSTLNIKAFWISNAKRNYTRIQYQHINVEDLITVIVKENSNIILNNSHLFDIILKALNEIKSDIRRDAGYLRVWNEFDRSCCPKDERALSDELKRLLKAKLENIIINREVEISSKIAGSGNDIPDLLVECQTGQSNVASVIIEVKGCWNKNLRESIETQLCNRYMCDDAGYKYGIYLIGWYWCDKWNEEYKKDKRKQIKVENRFSETDINEMIDYFNERAEKLSNDDKEIKCIVLDLSLPN